MRQIQLKKPDLIEATDSESNLAAREAVISFTSYLGQSSTISIPTIPVLTACLTRQVSSTLVSPHGVGTDTPGAYAGSRQSRSIDTYFLVVFLLQILPTILLIPSSNISRGVTT